MSATGKIQRLTFAPGIDRPSCRKEHKTISKWVNRCLAAALSVALWLVARLPNSVQRGLVGVSSFFYLRLARNTRQTITTNIVHVHEELQKQCNLGVSIDSFASDAMRATVKLLPETAVCWQGRDGAWRELIDNVHGEEALAALTKAAANVSTGVSGKPGVLLLSPHLGNWELLNMYLGAEFGLTVLYDPPKIAALEPLIRQARQRTKSTVLPIGPSGLRGMVQRLRNGAVVGLLPDQVPEVNAGVLAEFYGKQALTINLVHRLATKHEPRVFLVCALRKANGHFDIHFDELTEAFSSGPGSTSDADQEMRSATALNRAIERRVSQAPEQYQWSYKRFKRVDQTRPNIYRQAETTDARKRV